MRTEEIRMSRTLLGMPPLKSMLMVTFVPLGTIRLKRPDVGFISPPKTTVADVFRPVALGKAAGREALAETGSRKMTPSLLEYWHQKAGCSPAGDGHRSKQTREFGLKFFFGVSEPKSVSVPEPFWVTLTLISLSE
jgi:hypothetical protein